MVYEWLNTAQNWLFPAQCLLCGAAANSPSGQNSRDLCKCCHADLPRIEHPCPICALPLQVHNAPACGDCLQSPPPFDATHSAFVYEAPLAKLITDLKFNQKLAPARLLGQLLSESIAEQQLPRPDCLLPVPLHPKRIRERGFNQSLEIARFISKQHQIPIDTQLCRRTRHTSPQTGLDAKSRRKNIRGAFEIRTPCTYPHVAIVDDVITTGNTVTEISRLLRGAGVERIEVWSIARAAIK